MARVVDLATADESASLLEETGTRGLLSGGQRTDKALSTYLAEGETARYFAQNKSAGLAIEGPEGERTVEPDGGYRTVALLTDRRLLFVAGGSGGDETVDLPLADVIDVDVESAGMLSSQLVIETADERRFRFPSRGDLDAVAATIGDDAAAWSHAERLLEDADHDVGRARERLGMGEFDVAVEALDAAESRWQGALEALESVHEAAVAGLAERVDVRREMAAALRRRVRAAAAASDHAAAQSAWEDRDYERAAAAYDRAVESYRAAADLPGDEPTAGQLRRRLAGAERERAVLASAPIVDAEDARRRAERTDDPDVRAAAWETALERYRGALGLQWDGDGQFRVEHDAVREAAADAADAAIEARREAGRQWLATADKLAAARDVDAADRVYDRAEAHFRDALSLAESVFPEREGEIEGFLADIEARRAGEVDPAAEPTEAPLPVDSVSEALEVLEDETDLPPAGPGESGAVAAVQAGGQEAAVTSASQSDVAAAVDAAEADLETAEPPPAGAEGVAGALSEADPAAVLAGLRDLEPAAFRQLVAEVWAGRGWATTVFTANTGSIYDVFGMHEGSDERLLLWAVQAGPEEPIDAELVERVQATLERTQGATRATIATTGPIPEPTASRAAALGVELVDATGLCDLLAATDLLDRALEGERQDSADI